MTLVPLCDLIHLGMLAGHNADARANGGAIARGADQFYFDPILFVAAVVAKQGRQVVHI